ncbi:MAG: hypothetical protein ACRDBG_22300 [Waterburya sp.]
MPTCDDLATKDELQELRDQLNAVIGKKEDGGTVQVFTAGAAGLLVASLIGDTAYGLAQERAAKAITEIALTQATEAPVWQDLKEGRAKWTTTRGNGVKVENPGLNQVGKLTGQNTATAATAAKTSAAAANGVALVANLASIAATLAINIATVKVLDKRIEAEAKGVQMQLDATNQGMIRLYQKQQGDIDGVKAGLQANEAAIANSRQNVELIKSDISELENSNARIQDEISQLEADAQVTKAEIQAVREEVDAFQVEVEEITTGLKADIAKTEAAVNKAVEDIAKQKVLIDTAYEEIDYIKQEIANFDERISAVEIEIDELKVAFEDLKADLEPQIELQNIKSKIQEARLIAVEKKLTMAGGSGLPQGFTQGVVNAQNSLLNFADKLSSADLQVQELTDTDIVNNPEAFKTQFDQLLSGVQTETVTPAQLQDFRTNIGNDIDNKFDSKFNSLVIPKLNDLKIENQAPAFKNAMQEGLCESLNNPGQCPITPDNPSPTHGLKGLGDKIGDSLNGINTLLGGADLLQGQNILKYVRDTNQAVRHKDYGVQKIQEFASTAWRATHADKILNALNTAMVIHNGIMLSNNALASVGEAATVTLQAMGIQKSDGTEFDVSEIARDKVTGMLQSILGAENYAALTKRIAAYSRIYQASANVVDIVRGITDSARSIAETTCENTGKIGNALLESGVVYENAYQEMIDKVNPSTKAATKLEKFRAGVEILENGVSSISEISSEAIEIKESFGELDEAKGDWHKQIDDAAILKKTEKEERKADSQAGTDVKKADFGKNERDII